MKTFTSDEVTEKVLTVIEEQLQVGLDEVIPEALLMVDLGADWMDLVELAMELEVAFEIEVPDEGALRGMTVKQVVELVEKKVGLR